jgi:hypothetical protein
MDMIKEAFRLASPLEALFLWAILLTMVGVVLAIIDTIAGIIVKIKAWRTMV